MRPNRPSLEGTLILNLVEHFDSLFIEKVMATSASVSSALTSGAEKTVCSALTTEHIMSINTTVARVSRFIAIEFCIHLGFDTVCLGWYHFDGHKIAVD